MHSIPQPTSAPRKAGVGALVLTLASVLLVVAGCGGGPAGSAVANVGVTTTATNGGQPTQGSGSGKADSARAFSACMRRNGVPSFPDPSTNGGISINGGPGLNPDSSQFKAAQTKCQKLLPNGGQPSPAQVAKMQDQALKYSACMRSHGVPKFPDPQFSGGGVRLSLGRGNGIDPGSPAFKAAEKACADVLPGKRVQGGSGNTKIGSGPATGSAGAP